MELAKLKTIQYRESQKQAKSQENQMEISTNVQLEMLSKRQTLLSKLSMLSQNLPTPQSNRLKVLSKQLEKSIQRQIKSMQKNPATKVAILAHQKKMQSNQKLDLVKTLG